MNDEDMDLLVGATVCQNVLGWKAHGVSVAIAVSGVPATFLLAYLMWPPRFRRSLARLRRSRAIIIRACYLFVCCLLGLHVLGSVLYTAFTLLRVESAVTGAMIELRMSWYLTKVVEIVVFAFLSQGYNITGKVALYRALTYAGLFLVADLVVSVVVLQLYDVDVSVWYIILGRIGSLSEKFTDPAIAVYWLFQFFFFTTFYFVVCLIPCTRLSDLVPARPLFRYYIQGMFAIYLVGLVGGVLSVLTMDFGYCLMGLSWLVYYTMYPWVLYWLILADFFIGPEVSIDGIDGIDPGFGYVGMSNEGSLFVTQAGEGSRQREGGVVGIGANGDLLCVSRATELLSPSERKDLASPPPRPLP